MNKTLAALGASVAILAVGTISYSLPHPTPQSCRDAIAAADDSLSYAKKALTAAGDGFSSISSFSISGLNDATARLTEIKAPLGEAVDRYTAAKEECK